MVNPLPTFRADGNDISICPYAPSDLEKIECYHVEFEGHEVIYAEGGPKLRWVERAKLLELLQFERLLESKASPTRRGTDPRIPWWARRREGTFQVHRLQLCRFPRSDPA